MVGDGVMLVGDSAGLIQLQYLPRGDQPGDGQRGVYAGETVIAAKEKGDFSKAVLSGYRNKTR